VRAIDLAVSCRPTTRCRQSRGFRLHSFRGAQLALAIAASLTFASAARAGESSRTAVQDVLTDAKLYYTAPLRWRDDEWVAFAGALGAVVVAHHFDGNVRDHFAPSAAKLDVANDPHDKRDYVPVAAMLAGTVAFAALVQSRDGYREGWTMAESAGFTALTAYALKFAAGRERPFETTQIDRWRKGGDSFPSMHTSLTFAVGTVLAESGNERYRWLRRALGYGLGAGVAYSRLHDGQHWLSDTVAGAAVGMSTAIFVMNRRDERVRDGRGSIGIAPTEHGVMLTYRRALR
jgi:membrane-associated phospholipid phosphatase